jgi:hypothetical protein
MSISSKDVVWNKETTERFFRAIDEIVIVFSKIDLLKDQIKDITDVLKEDLSISPMFSKKVAKIIHKQKLKDLSDEISLIEEIFTNYNSTKKVIIQ